MSNPVAGQDYTINMTVNDDLTGATVTIEYRKPDGTIVTDVEPTSVDEETSIISYKIEDTVSVYGQWKLTAKIINTSGDIRYINPPVIVFFDEKLK
jgi:hypothetical protein